MCTHTIYICVCVCNAHTHTHKYTKVSREDFYNILPQVVFILANCTVGHFVPRYNPAACDQWKRTAAHDNHELAPDKWKLLLLVSAFPSFSFSGSKKCLYFTLKAVPTQATVSLADAQQGQRNTSSGSWAAYPFPLQLDQAAFQILPALLNESQLGVILCLCTG